MPTPEQLARIKLLATSPDELAFFFDQLTSPDWIPLLRGDGLLGNPPEPIEQGDGVMFPFWPASRYMVRVAAAAPRAAADVLWAARNTRNPRVWWDTVDALVKVPSEHARRFIPLIKRWVHHPWRLGLESSAAQLVHHLVAEGAREQAIDLARSLARLVLPMGWQVGQPWVALNDYAYDEEVPRIGRALAAFGPTGPAAFVEELEAFLAVDHPPDEEGRRADLSFVWRPAIEDHEQNWDFDREAKLVTAIRDGFAEVLNRSPEDLEGVVTRLLASTWPIVRRLGLHLLVERGDQAPALVEQALTNRDLLADQHHRHEFHSLLTARLSLLSPDAKRQFVGNVYSVAGAAVASAAEHRPDADAEVVRKVVLRRWLSAVSEHLEDADRAELEAIRGEIGEDPHPDFPTYHTSWRGSTSPLSSQELRDRDPDDVVDYLAAWEEPVDFGPHDSAEGLAGQLADAVGQDPERFAPTAPRYAALNPAYFDGLLNGLRKALQDDKTFDWEPVLVASEVAIAKPDESPAGDRDHTWEGVRITVVRLLERGLEQRLGEIPLTARDRVWALLSRLVEDADPTPATETRYGPSNMGPETYSLNTTRGAAFHALFLYLLWHYRQAGAPRSWSIVEQDRDASAVLDAHLDPERDPSIGVRAAYGWWLPALVDRDAGWVSERVDRIVGRAETDLERAAWEGFVLHGRGTITAHEVFAQTYAAYAEQLAARESKPDTAGRAGAPVRHFIDHLLLPWLWHPEIRQALPLRTLLASGKAWLAAEVVEEAGHGISTAEAEDVSPELSTAYQELWAFVLEATANLEGQALEEALAPFAWWFGSELPGEWTLPELLRLMERGINPDPAYGVLRRLAALAAQQPEAALRVVELLAAKGDEGWRLQVHEGEIRQVLEVSINAEDELIGARVEAVVHRLGRSGLGGLASLLGASGRIPGADEA